MPIKRNKRQKEEPQQIANTIPLKVPANTFLGGPVYGGAFEPPTFRRLTEYDIQGIYQPVGGGSSGVPANIITGTPGTLTVSTMNIAADPHTHAITSSSNPGAVASILATDANGYVSVSKLGIGIHPTTIPLQLVGSGFNAVIVAQTYRNTVGDASGLFFDKSRGTNAIPVIVNNGDTLGAFSFRGWDSAKFADAALLRAEVDAPPGLNDMPGRLVFMVTPNGSVTPITVLHIRSNGRISVSNTVATNPGQFNVMGYSNLPQLYIKGYTTQAVATAVAQIVRNDAAAGVSAMLDLTALGSGANGDGGSILLNGKSSTTAAQAMGLDQWLWVDATHASRKARRVFNVYDTAVREVMRIEASGTAPMLGFYGGAAVARGAALTTQLTTITHTAPGTPDYAVQDFVDVSLGAGWAFANHDEANSVLSVIANLQTRVSELEARLGSATGVNLFA